MLVMVHLDGDEEQNTNNSRGGTKDVYTGKSFTYPIPMLMMV